MPSGKRPIGNKKGRHHARNIEIEKLTGTRETKSAFIYVDGVYMGMIERFCPEEFQTPASMRRTNRFSYVEVGVKKGDDWIEETFSCDDGYTSRTATTAAKRWAVAQLS